MTSSCCLLALILLVSPLQAAEVTVFNVGVHFTGNVGETVMIDLWEKDHIPLNPHDHLAESKWTKLTGNTTIRLWGSADGDEPFTAYEPFLVITYQDGRPQWRLCKWYWLGSCRSSCDYSITVKNFRELREIDCMAKKR